MARTSAGKTPKQREVSPYTLTVRSASGSASEFPVRFHPDHRDQAQLDKNRAQLLGSDEGNLGVLVIYSGGTIGSAPNDPKDPQSPQVVKSWPELVEHFPPFREETPYALNFRLDAVAFEDPLDSSNMGPTEWNAVALLLKEYMEQYEGFVIAHGTDTMVYSASALSFMLENLKKPVILTGSQLSAIGNVRNDAQQNLITAIEIANWRYSRIPKVPEVCILFGNQLLRGNRATKVDASGYDAYNTPNYPVLGRAGAKIEIYEERLRRVEHQEFSVNERLDTNVMDVVVFPGIQNTELLSRVLEIPDLRAIVLRTFGAGNTPTPPEFLAQLKVARDQNILVVNVTQCARGSVEMGLYETSAVLMKYGVVSGIDSTPVAALTKLMVLLGDDRLTQEEVAQRVQEDLCGEQSESVFVTPMRIDGGHDVNEEVTLDAGARAVRMLAKRELAHIDDDTPFRHASLILHSASVVPGEADRVNISVYINVSRDEALHVGHEKLACDVARLATEDGTLVFDVTNALEKYIDVRRNNAFTVELTSPNGQVSWTGAELAVHTAAT